jgi:hypothetical protein
VNPTTAGTALLVVAVLALSSPAEGFPPYRSTDAETAEPWTLEGRLGLLRFRRDGGENAYSSPLLRLNLGLPRRIELISELEYEPEHGLADAAVGFKWVPVMKRTSVGIEAVALLPTSVAGGTGIEANLLVTDRHGPLRFHFNLGAFADGRPDPSDHGWKTSVLVERDMRSWRPGIEVFVRHIGSEPLQILVGPGAIIRAGKADVRLGIHIGLTDAAADLITDTWVAAKRRVR